MNNAVIMGLDNSPIPTPTQNWLKIELTPGVTSTPEAELSIFDTDTISSIQPTTILDLMLGSC